MGENEGAFRGRLSTIARELRDASIEKLRDKYEAKIERKRSQLERAEHSLAREQAEANSAAWNIGAKVLGGVLGNLFGGRRSSTYGTVGSAGRAYKQRQDVRLAEKKLQGLEQDLTDLETELADDIDKLTLEFDPESVELTPETIKPYKKNIDIRAVALVWLPHDENGQKVW